MLFRPVRSWLARECRPAAPERLSVHPIENLLGALRLSLCPGLQLRLGELLRIRIDLLFGGRVDAQRRQIRGRWLCLLVAEPENTIDKTITTATAIMM